MLDTQLNALAAAAETSALNFRLVMVQVMGRHPSEAAEALLQLEEAR